MVAGVVRKKRPCSECRRWFLADARVGERQRTCGSEACQEARRAKTHQAWRDENRDYDRDRRWRLTIGAAKEDPESAPPTANAPAPIAGVPWDVVQTEMKVEGRVILAGVVRVMGAFVQTEMRRQAEEITAGVARHGPGVAQTEMEGFR
jgi:hypothetical protein